MGTGWTGNMQGDSSLHLLYLSNPVKVLPSQQGRNLNMKHTHPSQVTRSRRHTICKVTLSTLLLLGDTQHLRAKEPIPGSPTGPHPSSSPNCPAPRLETWVFRLLGQHQRALPQASRSHFVLAKTSLRGETNKNASFYDAGIFLQTETSPSSLAPRRVLLQPCNNCSSLPSCMTTTFLFPK